MLRTAPVLPGQISVLYQTCQLSHLQETTQGWVDRVQTMPEIDDPELTSVTVTRLRRGISA
jgi:hypothetical protein